MQLKWHSFFVTNNFSTAILSMNPIVRKLLFNFLAQKSLIQGSYHHKIGLMKPDDIRAKKCQLKINLISKANVFDPCVNCEV